MDFFLALNNLDYLLIFILLIGMLVGMLRGATPQIISIFSIFGALLITLWLYRLFADNILQGLGMGSISADVVSFLLILFVSFISVRLTIKAVSTPPEEKKQKVKKRRGQVGPVAQPQRSPTQRYIIGPLSTVAAMILGVVTTGLWIALILVVLQFFYQDAVLEVGGNIPGRGLAAELRGSTLVDYFNLIMYWIFAGLDYVDPPSQEPNILKYVLDRVI